MKIFSGNNDNIQEGSSGTIEAYNLPDYANMLWIVKSDCESSITANIEYLDVESGYDYLYIDGIQYNGYYDPFLVSYIFNKIFRNIHVSAEYLIFFSVIWLANRIRSSFCIR